MEINPDVCRAVAIQYGLPLQFVIKEFHLFNVLSQMAQFSSVYGTDFVFKGGTALSKVYLGSMQRFSEDLDFDYSGDLNSVKKISKEIAQKIVGYEINEFRQVKDTVQFYCNYQLLDGKDHVRIDIAAKKIVTSSDLTMKAAVSEFTTSSVSGFYVYSIEDLMARKMHALLIRAEGKDFYDVYMGLSLCKKMGKAIVAMLKSEGKKENSKQFIEKLIDSVKKSDPKNLKKLTNPFIPLAYRPKDWLELKNDLLLKLQELEL